MISTSWAWLVKTGRQQPRLGFPKVRLSVCYLHPLNLTELGCTGQPSICVSVFEDFFFFRTSAGWKCWGINTPRSSPQARILGNWGINIPASSPPGGIIMRHVFYIVSPIFSYGIKPQLATVVAGSVRARVFPTPPLLVPEPPKYTHWTWIPVSRSASGSTHGKIHDVEKRAQDLK